MLPAFVSVTNVAVRRDAHRARVLGVASEHVDLESCRQRQLRVVGLRHDPREVGGRLAGRRQRGDVDPMRLTRRVGLPILCGHEPR
jgi:hypothetical protein